MQRWLVVVSFASGCLLVVLSLATTLVGSLGDAIAHVLIGLFGFVVAWLFALELGLVTFAIARARSFTVSRAASDIAIALIACAVLAPVNGGGLVGVALMDTASPWTRLFVFALGFSFFAIVRRMFRDASTARLTHRVVVERVENAAPVRTRTNNTNDVEHRTLRPQEHHATPSLSLLDEVPDAPARVDATDAARLVHALSSFDIDVSIDETCIGPSVVTYEATLAAGTKLSRVLSLEEDLSLACGKRVRVISSGRRVGFELTREERARVGLRRVQSPWLRDAEIDALTRRLSGEGGVDVRTADRKCQRSTTCSFRPQRLGDRATSGDPQGHRSFRPTLLDVCVGG